MKRLFVALAALLLFVLSQSETRVAYPTKKKVSDREVREQVRVFSTRGYRKPLMRVRLNSPSDQTPVLI
jgi:hypothetical protein